MTTETNDFNRSPILNSPYERPTRHWELDEQNRPTSRIVEMRRPSSLKSPIVRGRARPGEAALRQGDLFFEADESGVESGVNDFINSVRAEVEAWRTSDESRWGVTAETARLLRWWRDARNFPSIRPFFCQVEAIETLIWLTEVAPSSAKGRRFLEHLALANHDADPFLHRTALKLATGAGKTTVMAMIIAWQTVNTARHGVSPKFTNAFLVTAPGITIKDRLRVLVPNDPEAYYRSRSLVPPDYLPLLETARVVVTNYHAFMPKTTNALAAGTKRILAGPGGGDLSAVTLESDGEMIRRVLGSAATAKRVLLINDEAHHCYRHRPDDAAADDAEDPDVRRDADAREEARRNEEAARVWISGLEKICRHLPGSCAVDLSATPFFLGGSGYKEGTLFPWTVCDFSLMDALECGIVKLPRIPIDDNVVKLDNLPLYRDLWQNLKGDAEGRAFCALRSRKEGAGVSPDSIPSLLRSAIKVLYDGYERTFAQWKAADCKSPPCFIFVCQNTTISRLVYSYVSGYDRTDAEGSRTHVPALCPLFDNYDENGEPLSRPNTILIDSTQLESGDALPEDFEKAAAEEIAQFREEIAARTGDRVRAQNLTGEEILREVMNTVGKPGRLGESVRCVVSVSMLTEGWDANTVTHILGVRAFGTQLLCEQVVGRALRRLSYEPDENGLFRSEYADIFGIPFNFVSGVRGGPPITPPEYIRVRHVSPDRDALVLRFPNVLGYTLVRDDAKARFEAKFTDDSAYVVTPDDIGPTKVAVSGVVGASENLGFPEARLRASEVVLYLAGEFVNRYYGRGDYTAIDRLNLFAQVRQIVARWLDEGWFRPQGGVTPDVLKEYPTVTATALEKINAAVVRSSLERGEERIVALLNDFLPCGSTFAVDFPLSRNNKAKIPYEADAAKSHVNYAVCDSSWEVAVCRMLEAHPKTRAYARNERLGFEVPYALHGESRKYRPDFLVDVDDGRGADDPLHLVLEVKGYRYEDADEKRRTMRECWVPGVNALGDFGRWAFVELDDGDFFGASDLAALVAKARAAYDAKLGEVTA